MKNADKYRPTKFVYRGNRLIASRDVDEVSVASRLNADLTAAAYDAALKTHATGRLLDLGCGSAPLYVAYKRFVEQVTCVDRAGSAHGRDFLDVEADLSEPLPFDDAAFDTLILSDVLEHIPRPEPLWKEMHRVLAPGGKLLMNVPSYYCLHEQPRDFFRYTEFALRRFAEITGLAVLELRAVGGAKQVIADILAKKFVSWPGVGSVLASTVQWIGARGNMRGPSRVLNAEIFPLGYFLVAQKPPATGRKSADTIVRRESQSEPSKRVVVYRNDLLPLSETFVRQQLTALTHWQGLFVGKHRSSPSLDLAGLNTRIFTLRRLPLISRACCRLAQILALEPLLVKCWLARLRPHLVHVHFGMDAVAVWPAMRKLQVPMVVTLHGYDVNINTAWWEAGFGGRKNRFYHRDLVEMSHDSRVSFVAVSQMIRHRAI
ncbi:MAG: methyltransferase domain-containing protein, partial [Betaproteobacteria bacterium]